MDHRRLPWVGPCLTGDGLESKDLGTWGDYVDGGFVYPKEGMLCSCFIFMPLPNHSSCTLSIKTKQRPYLSPSKSWGMELNMNSLTLLMQFTKAYPSIAIQIPTIFPAQWIMSLFLPYMLRLPWTPVCLILLGKDTLTLESSPPYIHHRGASPICQGSKPLCLRPCLQRADQRMLPTILCVDEPL